MTSGYRLDNEPYYWIYSYINNNLIYRCSTRNTTLDY